MRQNKEKICAVEGCENKVRARGYCNKHYYQLIRSGKLEKIRPQHNVPIICTVEGCKNNAVSIGLCKKHYKRWYDTGSPHKEDLQRPLKTKGMAELSLKERLEKFSKRNEKTGCIEWTGSCDCDGYGQTSKDRNYRTHRLAYEIYVGPIPEGKLVCHHCDNPSCINTDHLYLGTHKDNVRDKMERGRANIPTGEKSASSKLTEEQAIELIRAKKSGKSTKAISDQFNISYYTVLEIVRGRSWKHLDRDSIQPESGEVRKDSLGRVSSNAQTKLSEDQVRELKKDLLNGFSLRQASDKFGVSKKLIMNIRDEKVWKHIPWPTKRKRKVKRRRKLC